MHIVNWPRLLAPTVLLGAFWFFLPLHLSNPTNAASNDQCLTVSDTEPHNGPRMLATLQRCRALYPDDVELLADLGYAYESAGRGADAERVYEEALAVDPAFADLRLRLGRLLLNRGAVQAAREQAELALRVQPNRRAIVDLLQATAKRWAGASR